MTTVTFLITVLIGLAIVSSSYIFFSAMSDSMADASSIENLREVTAYTSSSIVSLYEQAKKGSFISTTVPVVNMSLNIPKRILGQYYTITVENDTVTAVTDDGNSASSKLPYSVNSTGEIDSKSSTHVILIYRTARSSYNISLQSY